METLVVLAHRLPSILCICAAIFLLHEEKDGWGWLLFMALLLWGNLKITRDVKNDRLHKRN